nr:MAG TPA: hypothetical protein [Caudoviricetes sp.]
MDGGIQKTRGARLKVTFFNIVSRFDKMLKFSFLTQNILF